MFIVLSRWEDEPSIDRFETKQQLEKFLEEYTGKGIAGFTYLDKLPDFESFPSRSALIVEGRIVKPVAKEITTVKSWEFK